MKSIIYRIHLIPFFFCLTLLPAMVHGQARDKNKTLDLLCHNWKSNFEKSPKKMDCFPPDSSSTIRFLRNGYLVFSEKKGPEGVWNYDAARNNLYIIVNGSLWKYRINAITAAELAVEGTGSKNPTVWYFLKAGE